MKRNMPQEGIPRLKPSAYSRLSTHSLPKLVRINILEVYGSKILLINILVVDKIVKVKVKVKKILGKSRSKILLKQWERQCTNLNKFQEKQQVDLFIRHKVECN